jgi:hypothetical protein
VWWVIATPHFEGQKSTSIALYVEDDPDKMSRLKNVNFVDDNWAYNVTFKNCALSLNTKEIPSAFLTTVKSLTAEVSITISPGL